MASSTLKTQFSPYIAQLGMTSKGMLSAFGDAVDEYELDKRKDILFGIQEKQANLGLEKSEFDMEQARIRAPFENEGKELDVQNKRFEVNELNPLKKTTEQNRADKTGLELQGEQYMFNHDAHKIRLDTLKNQQTVANVNATYAEQEKQLDIGAKANTQKLTKLKLEDASSDDIIKKTASFFYTDSNGDGIIDEKDFAAVQKELSTNPKIPKEKLNEAYMYAKERVLKLNELDSKAQKNLGITHKQGTVSDGATKETSKTLSVAGMVDGMIKNYDEKNVGWFDATIDDIKKYTGGADKGDGTFMQSVEFSNAILRNSLFGSALTEGELKSARGFMPSRYASEADFKEKTEGLLRYYDNLIDARFEAMPPEKQKGYYETYKAYKSDIADSLQNIDKRWGVNRQSKPTVSDGNTTKGTPKFSTKKEDNTTTPIDLNNNKYF